MHVITQKRIWDAQAKWPHTTRALESWCHLINASAPKDFSELKRLFPATDKVGSQHVFDIAGNKLHLIAIVQYRVQKLFIQHVLDHAEYDKGKWRE